MNWQFPIKRKLKYNNFWTATRNYVYDSVWFCVSVCSESFHILWAERPCELVFALPWCKFEWWELQFSGQGTNQDSEASSSVSCPATGFLLRCWSHPVPPFPNHRLHLCVSLFCPDFPFVSWPRVMPVLPQAGSALCTGSDMRRARALKQDSNSKASSLWLLLISRTLLLYLPNILVFRLFCRDS